MIDRRERHERAVDRRGHNKKVAGYYSDTLMDYLLVWTNRQLSALHFGYKDKPNLSHNESLSYANEVLANAVEIKQGERVLDAGCGLGGSSFWLASNRAVATTGVALGYDQILQARKGAIERNLSHKCVFLVADFERLPFSEASFDVVWAQESLCHALNKSAFFEEAYRILKPDGRLILSDFFLRSNTMSFQNKVLMEDWLAGWEVPSLWTAANHYNSAKSFGFRNIGIKDVTSNTFSSHLRLYNFALLTMPIASILKESKLINSAQVGNIIAAARQFETLKKDCWFYAIMSAHK